MPKRWNWRRILHFSLQLPKLCTSVSSLVNGAEFIHTLLCQKRCTIRNSSQSSENSHSSRSFYLSQMAWTGIEALRQTIEFSAAPSLSKKWIKLITKTIGNRKKRLCVRLRSGDKHHLRKSSDRKAQIRKAFVPCTGLICAFRSEDFLRWCLSPERNLTHNLFFLFPIVFVINWFTVRRRSFLRRKNFFSHSKPFSLILFSQFFLQYSMILLYRLRKITVWNRETLVLNLFRTIFSLTKPAKFISIQEFPLLQ